MAGFDWKEMIKGFLSDFAGSAAAEMLFGRKGAEVRQVVADTLTKAKSGDLKEALTEAQQRLKELKQFRDEEIFVSDMSRLQVVGVRMGLVTEDEVKELDRFFASLDDVVRTRFRAAHSLIEDKDVRMRNLVALAKLRGAERADRVAAAGFNEPIGIEILDKAAERSNIRFEGKRDLADRNIENGRVSNSPGGRVAKAFDFKLFG